MGIEENKEVVLRLIEEMDKGNIGVVDELITSDFVMHRIGGDDIDRETYKVFHQQAYAAMPDYKMTIDEIISEGDKVSVRAKRSFTQKRYPKGKSATGNKIKVATYVYFRLEGEKIAEGWVLRDNLSYYQQHGVLPSNEEIESKLL